MLALPWYLLAATSLVLPYRVAARELRLLVPSLLEAGVISKIVVAETDSRVVCRLVTQ